MHDSEPGTRSGEFDRGPLFSGQAGLIRQFSHDLRFRSRMLISRQTFGRVDESPLDGDHLRCRIARGSCTIGSQFNHDTARDHPRDLRLGPGCIDRGADQRRTDGLEQMTALESRLGAG